MGIIADLVARITGDVSGFRKAMSDGAQAADGFGKSWMKAGADVATAASRITSVTGGMIGAVVGYTAKMGIAYNSMKEDALATFEVQLQSAEKAAKLVNDIQGLAAKTPLESSDITSVVTTLLQFQIAGEETIDITRRLGDATGGSAEKLKGIALAFGQTASAGKLQGQDLNQMISQGWNPLNFIVARTGETMEQVRDRMSKGAVSAAEVKQALVDATSEGGQYFGLMEKRGKTASGLWSTMVDNMKMTAGAMFEPASDSLKRFLQAVTSDTAQAGINQWAGQMQSQIASVMRELDLLIRSNSKGAIQGIGDAFLWCARGATELLKWIRQSGPEIVRQTQQYTAFLVPIGQWIAKNPGLVAGIIAVGTAFKALQILGVVSAFTSLIAVIGPTLTLLGQIPPLLMAIKTAAVATSGPMLLLFANPVGAGILVGLGLIALAFAQVAYEARKANIEADRLDREFADAERGKREKVLDHQGASTDETIDYLKNQRRMAETNRQGLEKQAKSAGKPGSGEDLRTVAQLNKRAQEASDFVAQIDAKLTLLGVKAGTNMGNAAGQKIESAADRSANKFAQEKIDEVQGKTGAPKGGGSRKEIDKALATHRNDGMEAQYHGYDKIRDFMGMGGTKGDVQSFAGNMKGVSPELAAQLAQLYEQSDKSAEALDALAEAFMKDVKGAKDFEKRADIVGDKVEHFAESLLDLQEVVPKDEIKDFAEQFNDLSEQFQLGQIDADAYRDSLKNLDNRIKDSKAAHQGIESIGDTIDDKERTLKKHDFGTGTKKGLSDETSKKAAEKFDNIHAEAESLAESFQHGEISAAKFAQEMTRLKKATDEVTEAAIKEETEKRKKALAAGDFKGAGLDFGKAVSDKFNDTMADAQLRQWDNAVQNMVNQFLPLGLITQTVSDGFQSVDQGLTKFTDGLQSAGKAADGGSGGGGGPSGQEANQIYANFISSVAGQIDTMKNNIDFLRQALEMVSDPQERQQMINQISQLNANIAKLNKSVNTFSGKRSNDPIFRDPGITGGGSQMSIHNNINIPNVYQFTQSDIDHLANSLSNSFQRMGNPAFQGGSSSFSGGTF